MGNVTQEVIARIEEYRATNKQPCKNYATEAAAEKATHAAAAQALQCLGPAGDTRPVRYIVFYVPAWGRWCGALDYTELLSRNGAGGYLGCVKNVFSY